MNLIQLDIKPDDDFLLVAGDFNEYSENHLQVLMVFIVVMDMVTELLMVFYEAFTSETV